jgi:hypothetical protein
MCLLYELCCIVYVSFELCPHFKSYKTAVKDSELAEFVTRCMQMSLGTLRANIVVERSRWQEQLLAPVARSPNLGHG